MIIVTLKCLSDKIIRYADFDFTFLWDFRTHKLLNIIRICIKILLTHICLVDSFILINWMGHFMGVWSDFYFIFIAMHVSKQWIP